MEVLNLNPNEMAFRKIYMNDILSKKITTVFRPGNRSCGDFRGYCVGQVVDARILNNVGADWAGIRPVFINEVSKKIEISDIEMKKINKLTNDDFIGSSLDIHDKQSLIYNLGVVYNLSTHEITCNSIITKISFRYID